MVCLGSGGPDCCSGPQWSTAGERGGQGADSRPQSAVARPGLGSGSAGQPAHSTTRSQGTVEDTYGGPDPTLKGSESDSYQSV